MYRYRHQIRALILLLLVAGLAYGGLKGWMYLNVKQAMEEISVATAGQVELGYEGIDTELSGAVTIRGLTLVPNGAPVPVKADMARLSGPPLSFFLLGQERNDPPPPRMFVDIEGLRVDLDEALIDNLREQFGESPGGSRMGCGPSDDLNPVLLKAMGFEQLVINLSFSYEYDQTARRLDAALDFDLPRIERVTASFSLGDVQPDALAGGTMTLPTIISVGLDTRVEPEFGNGYLKACAAELKMDVDSYRRKLVNETLAMLSTIGLQLGPGLSEALAEYHQHWGDLRISARPTEPLNPMSLMFSPPSDWTSALGMQASINGRPITDLSFQLSPPDPDQLAILLGQEVEDKGPVEPQRRYRRVFRPVPVAELARHVGAEVKLKLVGDLPERHGLLVEAQGDELKVQQRLHGGKFTAHVQFSDVASAEVQFVEEIPTK